MKLAENKVSIRLNEKNESLIYRTAEWTTRY